MDYLWKDDEAAQLTDEVAEVVYLSRLVGADIALTQPGGGNSSVKRRETDLFGRSIEVLRVKGSGTDMASIGADGFTGLRLADLATLGRHETLSDEQMMTFLGAAMVMPGERAPSVETPLHSVLPYRFVVHTHDFATQALSDTPHGEAHVREALGNEAVFVDYFRPGFPLARAVTRLPVPPDRARGMVLGNHGLIAWGDSAKACYESLHHLITRAERYVATGLREPRRFVAVPGVPAEQRRQVALEVLPRLRAGYAPFRGAIFHLDDSARALAFAADPRAAELCGRGMATPEHILRCGRVALHVGEDLTRVERTQIAPVLEQALGRFAAEARQSFERHRPADEPLDPVPRVVVLPGLGFVTAMKDAHNARIGALCFRHVIQVMEAAEHLGGFRFLDEARAMEAEYWSLELAKLKQPERLLARKIALVTGAASGIGRAIAERLVDEHAHVVLADVRGDAVEKTARALAARCKDPHRVAWVVADATSRADAATAVHEAVLRFGGLDILVTNAGVVVPGPVDAISEELWDRHFAVNVKGTFLVAKEAVRVMKAQGSGTIVLNASKGAFAPTVDNAAYASSKAAVAALTRNLATELGPHGIRVNCFNADFVDTPLMASLIAERAALHGVSVEEQTRLYRERNLLRVGPLPPAAVAEAVLFLASARAAYTTGAALPIDGGIKEAMPR